MENEMTWCAWPDEWCQCPDCTHDRDVEQAQMDAIQTNRGSR